MAATAKPELTPYEKAYLRQAIEAAKDLNYGADVILRIKKAKGDGEIQRIMISARHRTDEW